MTPTPFRFLVLAAACLATACQAPVPAGPTAVAAAALAPTVSHAPAAPSPAAREAGQVRLRAAIRPGGTRQLLAAVAEHTKADIAKLEFSIALQSAPDAIIGSDFLTNAELDDELVFSNLKNGTGYRIQARAYKADGAGGFTLISVDAESTRDFQVLLDDVIAVDPVPVQLMAVTFSGTATSGGVTILPGGYAHPQTESVGHKPKN